MMEFGYLGSSSSLSPLARPFTLDHSILPKTETFMNFSDPPPAVPFSSSLSSWQYSLSSDSNLNCYSGSSADLGVDSIRTTYLTSENYYPYFGVPSLSSPSTQMPPINAKVSTTSDAFAFPRYSGEILTSHVESKTYYPSFVSSVVEDDVPVVWHKPSYDLSSISHITPSDGSSKVDYHQSLSDLKYEPPWGSYWDRIDRLADEEMGKPGEYHGNFCCTQTEGVGSYVYKSYPKQGASTAESPGIAKESSAVIHGTHLNFLGGESPIVNPLTCELNSKPLSTPGSCFTPYNPVRTLGIPMFPKSHANVPPVEAATTFLNHQNPYASQDQNLQLCNAGKSGSVTIKRPSPLVVIRPPSVGSSVRVDKKDQLSDSCSSNIRGELPNKCLAEDHLLLNKCSSNEKLFPPVVIRPPSVGSSVRVDKKDHLSDSSSFNIRGELPNKCRAEDVEEHLSKAGMELQFPDMIAPLYSFTSASGTAKNVSSIEVPLESLDKNYPALDSPCWKGVSSFGFSPSKDHGDVTPELLVEKPESLGDLKIQQSQFCTPSGEGNAKIPYQKEHENSIYQENGYVELGSLLCPDRLPNVSSPMKVDNLTYGDGVNHGKMSSSNLEPFLNKIEKLTMEFVEPNDSKSCPGLRPSQLKQPDSERDLELGFGVDENGLNCNDTTSKLDVQKLVETIHNLSELLLFQCSDDASALSEVGHKALLLAMKNLDAYLSKVVPNLTLESDLCKEASSLLGFGNHHSEQGTKNSELSNKEVKKFTDWFSAKVDEDVEKDNKVTRDIKKVLEENFSAEEEMQSEALLYKNLWLEAEAALCFVSFKARYERIKTEMDKYKSTKKIAEPVKTFEEPYNEFFPDPSNTQKGNPIIEAFKTLHKPTQDPSASRKTEAEASFRARLDILNNRLPNQNSVHEGDETDEEAYGAFAETIKNVEKLLISDDVEDCAMTNLAPKVTPNAIGITVASNSVHDSPSPSTSKVVDNVEASVMTRFQVLKDRGLNAISERSGQQSEQAVSSDHSGPRNPWIFNAVLHEDDIVDEPLFQGCKVSEHKMVKGFHVCASGDVASQLVGNVSLGTQISSGWCDGSLSDWEDVLKDEFTCQK